MIRISESQARLWFAAGEITAPVRGAKRREDLPENMVAKQICDFLRASGWTVTRQQSGLFAVPFSDRRVTIGERGLADYRAERPRLDWDVYAAHQLFYFETKAPGKKPRREQELWLEQRAATGTPAEWFDGYDQGKRKFVTWYRERFGYR